MLPIIIGGAVLILALATGSNNQKKSSSESRTITRKVDSEKKIENYLTRHRQKTEEIHLASIKANIKLINLKNQQDKQNLKTLKMKLAKTKSKKQKKLLLVAITECQKEINKNYNKISMSQKLLN